MVKVYRTVKRNGKTYSDLSHGKYIPDYVAFRPLPLHVHGIAKDKTITRTIKMYMPNKTTAVVKQKAEVTFDANVIPKWTKSGKRVTVTKNGITFWLTNLKGGHWSTSSWKSYTVPTVSGYTASIKKIGKKKVYHTTKNQTVKVTYKKNKTSKAKAKKTTTKKSPIKVQALGNSAFRVTGIKSSAPLIVQSSKQNIYYYVSVNGAITNQGTLQSGKKHIETVKNNTTLVVYLGSDTGVTVTVGGKKIPFTQVNGTSRLTIYLGERNNSTTYSSSTTSRTYSSRTYSSYTPYRSSSKAAQAISSSSQYK